MSLETEIKNLTKAVETLIAVMQSQTAAAPAVAQVAAVATPVAAAVQAPVSVAAPAAAVAMPSLPTFVSAPAPAQAAVPFTDTPGLVQYTMSKYQQLGQEKGAKIQDVLNAMGLTNLSDVAPDHFATYFAQVEAIQ
jgi:hypothetical protein